MDSKYRGNPVFLTSKQIGYFDSIDRHVFGVKSWPVFHISRRRRMTVGLNSRSEPSGFIAIL